MTTAAMGLLGMGLLGMGLLGMGLLGMSLLNAALASADDLASRNVANLANNPNSPASGTSQAPDSALRSSFAPRAKPPAVPEAKNVPIDPELRAAAEKELLTALASADPTVRAHAVEAMRLGLGAGAKTSMIRALHDTDARVRFAGLMAAGELKLEAARQPALDMLRDDDINVRIAARYALHRLGDTRFTHGLERTARDPDLWVRRQTAFVLGRLGEPSAIRVLKPMLRDPDPGVRLEVAEALWRLKDEDGRNSLVAASLSAYPDDQLIALPALSAPHDAQVLQHVRAALAGDYQEVSLAAARAVGELGSDEGYGVALAGAHSKSPMQRMLAALAFGAIGRPDAQDELRRLLSDSESPDVRISAALAILQLKPLATAR